MQCRIKFALIKIFCLSLVFFFLGTWGEFSIFSFSAFCLFRVSRTKAINGRGGTAPAQRNLSVGKSDFVALVVPVF